MLSKDGHEYSICPKPIKLQHANLTNKHTIFIIDDTDSRLHRSQMHDGNYKS